VRRSADPHAVSFKPGRPHEREIKSHVRSRPWHMLLHTASTLSDLSLSRASCSVLSFPPRIRYLLLLHPGVNLFHFVSADRSGNDLGYTCS